MHSSKGKEVLIETLWNVKYNTHEFYAIGFTVLIETLWNVKMPELTQLCYGQRGINRNIVECKETSLEIFSNIASLY